MTVTCSASRLHHKRQTEIRVCDATAKFFWHTVLFNFFEPHKSVCEALSIASSGHQVFHYMYM